MSEEVASAFVERRAFEAALAETEMHRAALAALESQLGQAHEATLLAQADAETLAVAVRAWASTHQPMECEECEDLVTLARDAHPGTPLADEVRAARAANHIMYEALRQIEKHQEGAYTTEEGAGANVEACEWCGDMRDIASAALARVKAGGI